MVWFNVNLNPLTSNNYSLLKVLLCTVIFITISTLNIDKQTSNEKWENISEGILSSWNTRFLRIIHLEKCNHHLGVLGFDSWSQEAEEICLWWLFFVGHFLLYISALTTETSMWAVLCSVFREKLFLFRNVWKLQFGLALNVIVYPLGCGNLSSQPYPWICPLFCGRVQGLCSAGSLKT